LSTPSSSDAHSIQNLSLELPGQTVTKSCCVCKTVKPLSEFGKNRREKDGLNYECKDCFNKRQSKQRRANPFPFLLSEVKRRAKQKGWGFDIDEDYLRSLDRDICPYLETPIYWTKGQGNRAQSNDSKSLDRIDSAKGYVKGNLIICSDRANRILGNATAEEMETIARNFKRIFNSTQPTDATTKASD
jgi:hypothetical protein